MFLSLIRMSSRCIDTDILQIRNVFARTPTNNFIPSSHILIANGDGSTHWGSASSIVAISSFNTVKGNDPAVSLNANLFFNTLQVSTVGVASAFQSYVDPVANVLMLSNIPPPFAVTQGSVPAVTSNAAILQPNASYLQQQAGVGVSSIKFLGVNDIQLSTFTGGGAMFISISSFTSIGYSTISGETFNWRPTLYSTLSTSAGTASFVSTIPFTALSPVTGRAMTNPSGNDLLFSSITFSANHLMQYIDNHTSNTRIAVEVNPGLFFPPMQSQDGGATTNYVKQIVSYIQLQTTPSGTVIFNESSNVSWLTSQNTDATLSNYFTTPIRLNINPYSLQSNINLNAPNPVNLTVFHRIIGGLRNTGNAGFNAPVTYDDRIDVKGGLCVQMMNNIATLP